MKELQTIASIYKNEGETPLECLERFRFEHPEYKDAVLSYAGRLDPMAEGLLLILVNEENKNREKYLGLDKVYDIEVLFGIKTDTGDILGKVVKDDNFGMPKVLNEEVLESFIGLFTQKYPHYSSKTVQGKPLFQWAREGRLDEIEIPERTSTIYSIDSLGEREIAADDLLDEVLFRIGKVKGDFRQEEIMDSWKKTLSESDVSFPVLSLRVSCSSGAYMRTLAEGMASKLGVPGLAWRIKRVKIGGV